MWLGLIALSFIPSFIPPTFIPAAASPNTRPNIVSNPMILKALQKHNKKVTVQS